MSTSAKQAKGYKGLPMEGFIARWYVRTRGTASQLEDWKRQAAQITRELPDGAAILEVAPGPGYFAIELARLGRFHVTGLDISHTFVDIATEHARQAGVQVDFRLGNAASMPFDTGTFDLVVCQAAFKNFSQPVEAIDEMHRVLRDGGTAVIQDMRKDATSAAVAAEVQAMRLGSVTALMTRGALRSLRGRAYTTQQFQHMAASSAFGGGTIDTQGIGLELRLQKRVAKP